MSGATAYHEIGWNVEKSHIPPDFVVTSCTIHYGLDITM
jgi:hypothetical protein